jgi:hypothetical protein
MQRPGWEKLETDLHAGNVELPVLGCSLTQPSPGGEGFFCAGAWPIPGDSPPATIVRRLQRRGNRGLAPCG